jgi:uncharacterized protein
MTNNNLVVLDKRDEGVLVYSKVVRRLYLLEHDLFSNLENDVPDERISGLGLDAERPTRKPFSKEKLGLTIFPTTSCNLKCIYCYADANKTHKTLDSEAAELFIDQMVTDETKLLDISFHGGGEPTLGIDLIKKVVEHASSKADKTKFHIMTNATFGQETLDFLLDNHFSVGVSCDGPFDIQKHQRPAFRDTDKVVERVYDNIRSLRTGVRSTVTSYSVDRQPEIVEFFYDLGVKSVRLEPLFSSDRSERMGLEVDLDQYCDGYLDALKRGKELGVRVTSTLLDFDRCMTTFCGAAGNNYCLTPDNYVSACYEVTEFSEDATELIVGKIADGKIILYDDRIDNLRKRDVENMPGCSDCIAELQCGGGCLARSMRGSGDLFDRYEPLCDARQRLYTEVLMDQANALL